MRFRDISEIGIMISDVGSFSCLVRGSLLGDFWVLFGRHWHRSEQIEFSIARFAREQATPAYFL